MAVNDDVEQNLRILSNARDRASAHRRNRVLLIPADPDRAPIDTLAAAESQIGNPAWAAEAQRLSDALIQLHIDNVNALATRAGRR